MLAFIFVSFGTTRIMKIGAEKVTGIENSFLENPVKSSLGETFDILLAKLSSLKNNSTMYKTEVQIVSYGILYLNPSSHQCQPLYKKYIAV